MAEIFARVHGVIKIIQNGVCRRAILKFFYKILRNKILPPKIALALNARSQNSGLREGETQDVVECSSPLVHKYMQFFSHENYKTNCLWCVFYEYTTSEFTGA